MFLCFHFRNSPSFPLPVWEELTHVEMWLELCLFQLKHSSVFLFKSREEQDYSVSLGRRKPPVYNPGP
jgi:hypothetical protein